MAVDHKDQQNIAAFELSSHDEGSIINNHNNNNSGATSPSPRLAISSRDFYSEPSGSKTPPLNSLCSVPFKWEETPGKAKQSNSSSEAQDTDRSCRWDYDYDEDFDLNVFKVVDGSVGFEVQEKLVAVYTATPTNHDAGNDHMTPQSSQSRRCRRKLIFTKLLGDIMGRLRSAIDSARRIW